jgi:hypothetical protein
VDAEKNITNAVKKIFLFFLGRGFVMLALLSCNKKHLFILSDYKLE